MGKTYLEHAGNIDPTLQNRANRKIVAFSATWQQAWKFVSRKVFALVLVPFWHKNVGCKTCHC